MRGAEAPPFTLFKLKQFDSQLAQVVSLPLQLRPKENWMQDAFAWFRTRSRFDRYLPVYVDAKESAALVDINKFAEMCIRDRC